ncbi:hypothetical protein IWX46DRAFT_410549 [Phyllosticta citricarpa]|uniref:Secreted protein n=1 Tax=Phyllosticta citricarpa TaxID=55181 RepID=A0ABR1L8C9_9PEZI
MSTRDSSMALLCTRLLSVSRTMQSQTAPKHLERETSSSFESTESLCNAACWEEFVNTTSIKSSLHSGHAAYKEPPSARRKTTHQPPEPPQNHHLKQQESTMCTRTKLACGCPGQTTRCKKKKACTPPTPVNVTNCRACAASKASIASGSSKNTNRANRPSKKAKKSKKNKK